MRHARSPPLQPQVLHDELVRGWNMRRAAFPTVILLIIVIVFIFYPGLFLLTETPLFSKSWTLQDEVVSWLNFIPGISVVRYELFENWNVLWSSLRNMGAPVLSNEIQAAPLFPLTLALLWVPDPYFWNIFVVARTVLMWVGSALLARALRMGRIQSLIFVACFAGSVFVARWINHPWQNGFTVGIWFLLFVVRAFPLASVPWDTSRFLNTLGVAVSTYATITCGFPEASALAAVLAILVAIPIFVTFLAARPSAIMFGRAIADLTFGILTGAMLASPQVFALIEHVVQTAPGYRTATGMVQFPSL